MDIAHRYINKNYNDWETMELLDFFHKLCFHNELYYECENEKEKEMMEYLCSINFVRKEGDNKCSLNLDGCALNEAFALFVDSLTNKVSTPYSGFISDKNMGAKQFFNRRLCLQLGMFHGDYIYNNVDIYPFIICVFNEEHITDEPLCLNEETVGRDINDIEKAFLKILDIKEDTKDNNESKGNVYFVWDRRNGVFVFETREDMKAFERVCPFYKAMPKSYYYSDKKSMIKLDIERYINNPTPEGAQKIINSMKEDLGSQFPDMDIDVQISPMPEEKTKSSKPVKEEEVKKEDSVYFLVHPNMGATIFKNGNPYCLLMKYSNENDEELLERTKKFVEVIKSAKD